MSTDNDFTHCFDWHLVRETEKARLFQDAAGKNRWVPKSLIRDFVKYPPKDTGAHPAVHGGAAGVVGGEGGVAVKTDKELADELDAQDRLIARGLAKKACPMCDGTGVLVMTELSVPYHITCTRCDGKGHSWEGRPTK